MEKERLEMWLSFPETQERFDEIKKRIEQHKERLAMGGTINSANLDETGINTAIMVGEIRGMLWAINPEMEEE